MKCKRVLYRLNAYVHGEMPARLMFEVDEHLSACPSCRGRVERIRELGNILDSLSVPPLPEGFSALVMEEARKRSSPARQEERLRLPGWQPLHWLLDLSIPMRLATSALILLACFLGMFMSKELSFSGNQGASAAVTGNLDGFEWFSPTPPTSLGSAYLSLASID